MGRESNTAIIARKHHCIIRREEKVKPYNFLGTADEVIAQAPKFVQAYWNQNGFILSHRGAVHRSVINEMRSLLAHGAGASGFSKTVTEMYKVKYYNSQRMWHSLSDFRYHDPIIPPFAEAATPPISYIATKPHKQKEEKKKK